MQHVFYRPTYGTFPRDYNVYFIYTYIKRKILTFVKQCSIHGSRAMYILWEEKDKFFEMGFSQPF